MSTSSQSNNSQPLSKKPKLDIGRQGTSASAVNRVVDSQSSKKRDIIDELWGNDFEESELQQADEQEVLALSQMPNVSRLEERTPKPFQSSSHSRVGRESNIPSKVIHRNCPVNSMKNSPRNPLRRTASSGWPSANTFSPSQPVRFPDANKNSYNKNVTTNNLAQVEQLAIENKTLKEQLTRKSGEVNLIRDRLLGVQQECEKQKKDFADKMEANKFEENKLFKEIKSLKSQLEVKTMEMETAERRVQNMSSMNRIHPDSPRSRGLFRPVFSPANTRLSPKDDHLMCRHGHRGKHTYSMDLLKQLVTPELFRPSQPEPTSPSDPQYPNLCSDLQTLRVCQPSTSRGVPMTRDCLRLTSKQPLLANNSKLTASIRNNVEISPAVQELLSSPCLGSEPCSLSLLSPRLIDINSENAHQVISQVTESCLQVLLTSLQQLTSPSLTTKKYSLERHKESAGQSAEELTQTVDLLCHKELFKNERGMCARRALALQSLLVEFSNFAAKLILPSGTRPSAEEKTKRREQVTTSSDNPVIQDPHRILPVIKDIVYQIKIQHKTQWFEGVLAAVMVLLKSLLLMDLSLSQQCQDLIVQILQGVVSSRPGRLVLYFTLQVVLAAIKYPHVTASICQNSDKCILQALCMLLQLSEDPKRHVLSDLFTSWVLTLFYGQGLSSPKWLFSVPKQMSCQCRPWISRLCLSILGEACEIFPTAESSKRAFTEKLLKRGILLASTLLYHDEHFGANISPASEGHYEQYIWSMNTFDETEEIKLNQASLTILEGLSINEAVRKPPYSAIDSKPIKEKCDKVLKSLLFDDVKSKDIL